MTENERIFNTLLSGRSTRAMTAAQIDDELTASLTRVEQGIDTLAAHRDRLATALRDILEEAEDHEDIVDNPGGHPLPNAWMRVATLARTALGKGS